MRSFGCLAVLGSEDYFEGVCSPKFNGFRQSFMFGKSMRLD